MSRRQKYIPRYVTPDELRIKSGKELRDFIYNYVRENYAGTSYKNIDTNVVVKITVSGGRKTAYGEAIYLKKAVMVMHLSDIIRYAIYNNAGNRKTKDGEQVLCYLNYKFKCYIDNMPETLRVAVKFQKDGKFYYNIEVNKKPTLVRSKA